MILTCTYSDTQLYSALVSYVSLNCLSKLTNITLFKYINFALCHVSRVLLLQQKLKLQHFKVDEVFLAHSAHCVYTICLMSVITVYETTSSEQMLR